MKRCRKRDQVAGRAKVGVHLVDILGPVSVVGRPGQAYVSTTTHKHCLYVVRATTYPSDVLPAICFTMGDIQMAVNPIPWM